MMRCVSQEGGPCILSAAGAWKVKRSLSSSEVNWPDDFSVPLKPMLSAISVLTSCRWYTFSSMVPLESSLYTTTGFFWPSRHTRPIACRSWAGFQSESKRMRRFAPTRLRPAPPALVDSRNTFPRYPALNRLTRSTRVSVGVFPSRRHVLSPILSQSSLMRSRMRVKPDTTTVLSPEAVCSVARRICPNTFSLFEADSHPGK
mmetsp:Transcript_4964/g.6737  ORF Transcript_4964/g.6737 Transcript_4964/m.6737 type:complete len:202 (+) Transcript_4964:219-824(+)